MAFLQTHTYAYAQSSTHDVDIVKPLQLVMFKLE